MALRTACVMAHILHPCPPLPSLCRWLYVCAGFAVGGKGREGGWKLDRIATELRALEKRKQMEREGTRQAKERLNFGSGRGGGDTGDVGVGFQVSENAPLRFLIIFVLSAFVCIPFNMGCLFFLVFSCHTLDVFLAVVLFGSDDGMISRYDIPQPAVPFLRVVVLRMTCYFEKYLCAGQDESKHHPLPSPPTVILLLCGHMLSILYDWGALGYTEVLVALACATLEVLRYTTFWRIYFLNNGIP